MCSYACRDLAHRRQTLESEHLLAGEGPRPEAAASPGILQAGRERDHDGAILRSHSDPVLLNLQGMRDQCQACHYSIPSFIISTASSGPTGQLCSWPYLESAHGPHIAQGMWNHLHEQLMLKIVVQRRPQANEEPEQWSYSPHAVYRLRGVVKGVAPGCI